jgi:hypothetical protein
MPNISHFICNLYVKQHGGSFEGPILNIYNIFENLHKKLPISQNFNKIYVKIVKKSPCIIHGLSKCKNSRKKKKRFINK